MNERTVSILLIISILLSALPGAAFADSVSQPPAVLNGSITEETELSADKEITDSKTILHEDVALRKEYEKHFLLSDGSYQVALYNEPVHKLEDGKWVEVDNTLTLQNTRDGASRYVTGNGLADVSFADQFGDRLVTLRQDDYALSWGVRVFSGSLSSKATAEWNRPVQAEVVASDISAFSANQQKTLATKSSSAIQYRNALADNVDLEYIVLPSRVKENIILQSKQDISYYTVTVFADNLTARLLENREIEYYNNRGESVFTMTSPYMYDSAGELSEDIAVTLSAKGEGCYQIRMTPDAGWLSSPDRVYPVVLDPQVSVDTTRTNIIDNYVLENSGNQNRNLDRLYIGMKSGKMARTFIKYDTMPTIPATAQITDAAMSLTITSGTSTAWPASAYKVTGGDWESGTITWANMPEANTLLALIIGHNNYTEYAFSCKTAVQSWYSGSTTGGNSNYGIMLRYFFEGINDYNAVYSADCSNESKRPSLVISYSGIGGGTDFDSAESIALDASSSSNPYIKLYSGSGSFIASDDNAGGENNFRLLWLLSGNSTYYIGVKDAGGNVGSFYLNILIALDHNGDIDCHLRNVGSSFYMDIDDLDDPYLVHQWEYHGGESAQWTIKEQSDGYYTIESAYSDNGYLGITGSGTNADNVRLYYSIADRTRWKIYVKSTGEMLFEPKNGTGLVLYVPSNSKGDELQLSYISYASSNRHKWKIECQSETPLEGQRWTNWCWAASSRMFARHYCINISTTQDDVVKEVKTGVFDMSGTTEDAMRAINYYLECANAPLLELRHNPGGSNGRIFNEHALRCFMNDGHIVLAARDYYKDNGDIVGHAVLIAGYTAIFSAGELQYRYTIKDPAPENAPELWEAPQNTNGQILNRSYDWICNGKNAVVGERDDNGIWVGFVTVNKSYPNDICSPIWN